MEEPLDELYAFNWGRADAPWIETQSPYVLKDQTLNSTIRVKALDKAGNETIALLIPPEASRTLSLDRMITLLLVGSVALVSIGIIVYALVQRKKKLIATYEDHT
jgi:hypothetical protein